MIYYTYVTRTFIFYFKWDQKIILSPLLKLYSIESIPKIYTVILTVYIHIEI